MADHETPRLNSMFYRALDDGFEIVVYPMLFRRARLCLSEQDDPGIITAYCYDDPAVAIEAAKVWDGDGDPPDGWTRHPMSGRCRPGGDSKREKQGW